MTSSLVDRTYGAVFSPRSPFLSAEHAMPEEPLPTPDQNALLALEAMEQQDWPHATYHVSEMYYDAPAHDDYLSLVERWMTSAPDAVALLQPEGGSLSAQKVALLCEVHARQGRSEEALALLDRLLQAVPHTRILQRVPRWLADPHARAQVSSQTIMSMLAAVGKAFLGDAIEDADASASIGEIVPWLEQLVSEREDASLKSFVANLMRKLGHEGRALELANDAYTHDPSHMSAVVVALCHRSLDDLESAYEAYRVALGHDDEDVSVRLDMGDLLCGQGRIEEGMGWYLDVLRLQPDHGWALAQVAYWRYRQDAKVDDVLLLLSMAYQGSERAYDLFSEIAQMEGPYRGFLPEPAEASLDVARQMAERDGGSMSSIHVSGPEAASVQTVLHRIAQRLGAPRPDYTVGSASDPDPRQPLRDVERALWRFEGDLAEPNLPKPRSKRWRALVENLASETYFMPLWQAFCTGHTAQGLSHEDVDELLRLMVHPPVTPEDTPDARWVYRVQFACAALLAQSLNPDTWAHSAQRTALHSILFGPLDWSVDAAVVWFGAQAQALPGEHPMREEILDWLMVRMAAMPLNIHVSYIYALLSTLLRFDEVKGSLREDIEQTIQKMTE